MRRICKRCGVSEYVRERKEGNSEYCVRCQIYIANKERRAKNRLTKKCIICGESTDTKDCPHCNKPLRQYIKCKACRERDKAYQLSLKKGSKPLNTLKE